VQTIQNKGDKKRRKTSMCKLLKMPGIKGGCVRSGECIHLRV
jgi:hypothetical protein